MPILGKRILEGEKLVLDAAFPSTVIRLGGIYGPKRTRLLETLKKGEASYPSEYTQYTNRIHVDDCAGAISHLLSLTITEPIYIGVDNEAVDRKTLLEWLAGRLGAPSPQSMKGVHGRGTNKRCCSEKLIESGYNFRYPSFREGYATLI